MKMALLLIDVVNDFQFDDGEKLLRHALPIAKNIRKLKARALQQDVPVIYVNDNFKNWKIDFYDLVEDCLAGGRQAAQFVELVKPSKDDYHILKPSYSGFFATPLQLLLEDFQVDTLIITGIAGDMCVHFTANDAFMRGFKLLVPEDCIASETFEANQLALRQMKEILGADVRCGEEIEF